VTVAGLNLLLLRTGSEQGVEKKLAKIRLCRLHRHLAKQICLNFQRVKVAGGPGFEPRLAESESAVLPLNYPPTKPLKSLAFF
jgi:hypothetical protein